MMVTPKHSRRLLSEVQFLIIFISMVIMIAVVGMSVGVVSSLMLKDLRARAVATADDLVSLLEYPLYSVDDESAVRIATTFLSSGKISGIVLNSTASGVIFFELIGQDSPRIPKISRNIERDGLPLGSFTITFSDADVRESQWRTFSIALAIIISVLLANVAASRFIARHVRKPFETIFSAIDTLAEGNYQTKLAPTGYRDLDVMVALFNAMADKINRKSQEQKKIEQTLVAERQYFIDIIDFVPDATFIVDNDRRVVVWNRAAEAMTGIERSDILGKGDYAYAVPFVGEHQPILIDLLDNPDEGIEKSYTSIKRSGQAIFAESYNPWVYGGRGAYLWGVAAPIFDRFGKRSGAIEMIRDVTEFKQAEEEKIALQEQLLQTQKMESVGRLAGGIAHDFNNLLTVILGHAQLALTGNGPVESMQAHVQIIEETAQRSANLVRQLLAFARKQAIDPVALGINGMIRDMLTMLRRLIGEDIVVDWRPGDGLWLIWIDPGQVDQLLLNLCVNARDAIAGGGKISIETANFVADAEYCRNSPECLPGEYVVLAVGDDGCGMEKNTIDHIFEPFFTTKAKGRGTGMGLATVYGIVKQNKGFIRVSSDPGKGAAFKIHLPRFRGEGLGSQVVAAGPAVVATGETVLLVEDDALILEMTGAMLAQLGYAVFSTDSPRKALDEMQRHASPIQLLITDVVMPDMNGRELETALRASNPELKCLFISGYTADVIAHHGVLDNDVCFLQKPFSLQELAEKVRQALR